MPKYIVPPSPADPKSQMTDCTNMPDVIAAGDDPESYVRTVRDPGGKVYVYTTDLRKFRGEDVEVPQL